MFWRFGGYANISTIDTLLDKSDVTLEELLDESDLIQELKQHNTKLIEFLRDENTLQRLLKYVVAPGPAAKEDEEEDEPVASGRGKGKELTIKTSPDADKSDEEQGKAEKSRLKYAYVACEVLSSETWSILEALMANIPHLQEFWDFLRRGPPLDPLQAGYFTKVNETLLEKKTEEMLDFFKSSPGMVPAVLQHVDCPMVMDLLLKIISLEKAEGGQGIVDWLQSQDLIPTLLSYLSPDSPSSTQTSAGDFLKAIITISANASQNEQSCIGPNSLTRQLVSEPCMESLITSMLHGGNPLTVGVGIVIEVIRKNNSDYDPENGHNPEAPPTNHDPIYLGTLLRMFAKHVPNFMELILSSTHTVTDGDKTRITERGKLSSAWGTEIEPLGFDRFKTCELMAELLHCSNMGLLNERGGEEFVRQRDAERDRLRAAGAFAPHRDEDESAVDISEESTGDVNGNVSAFETSAEELRVANSSEEDGFEQVAAPERSEDSAADNSATSDDTFTEIQERSRLDLGDDLIDEPLSPQIRTLVGNLHDEAHNLSPTRQGADPLSPSTASLTEKVRRVSLEDKTMMSPPSESEDASEKPSPPHDLKTGTHSPPPLSPRPEDTPAPLFSRSSDPNRTPTAQSPEAAISPVRSREDILETSELRPEGDSSVSMEQEPSVIGSNTEPSVIDSNIEPSVMDSNIEVSVIDSNIETDTDGKPVVGDYLKIMFVEHRVVPTILSFFFRFPWNNFLHNVVYDVVQQVFNGPMERGYNRSVAINLFETGSITEQIIEGQRRSDEAQQQKNMRLGYMGHLTLVAEEVVKFSERHPAELLSPEVMDKVLERSWIDYVEQTLSETRERDNAILGGVRPDMSVGPRQAVLNAVNASQGFANSSALANAGLNGGAGMGGPHGFDSIDLSNNGGASSGAAFGGSASGSLLSGFGSSSDDEDEEMEEADEEDPARAAKALAATADAGLLVENTNAAIPLIAPPPAPLNIPPSRARRQLAAQLALNKRRAEEASSAAVAAAAAAAAEEEEVRNSDDPFAGLGDGHDDGDASDPFTLDEEEEDITASGRRDKKPQVATSTSQGFSMSRGLTSLFSPSSRGRTDGAGDEDGEMNRRLSPAEVDDEDDDDAESSGSESGLGGRRPLEATTSRGRIPLETDEDEDEDVEGDEDEDEMGEMVAPSEVVEEGDVVEEEEEEEDDDAESNSSDERDEGEMLSPVEKEKLRGGYGGGGGGSSMEASRVAHLGQPQRERQQQLQELEEEYDDGDDDEGEGEGLVEIAMPSSSRRKMG